VFLHAFEAGLHNGVLTFAPCKLHSTDPEFPTHFRSAEACLWLL